MVEIFGYKLFGCSGCKTRRNSKKRKRSYRGGYKYKQSGNNSGEDVSNYPMTLSRKRNRSNMNSDSGSGMGKGSKRRRIR
jgi:hypothetical protein